MHESTHVPLPGGPGEGGGSGKVVGGGGGGGEGGGGLREGARGPQKLPRRRRIRARVDMIAEGMREGRGGWRGGWRASAPVAIFVLVLAALLAVLVVVAHAVVRPTRLPAAGAKGRPPVVAQRLIAARLLGDVVGAAGADEAVEVHRVRGARVRCVADRLRVMQLRTRGCRQNKKSSQTRKLRACAYRGPHRAGWHRRWRGREKVAVSARPAVVTVGARVAKGILCSHATIITVAVVLVDASIDARAAAGRARRRRRRRRRRRVAAIPRGNSMAWGRRRRPTASPQLTPRLHLLHGRLLRLLHPRRGLREREG